MAGWCSRSHRRAPNSLRRRSEHTGRVCGDEEPLISLRLGAAIPPGHLVLLSPITSHRNGSRKDRRSPLLPMGLKAPFVRQRKPLGTRMSWYAPPVSCSNASRPGCLTKYMSTWCPSCLAVVSDCSTIWVQSQSNWKAYERSRPPVRSEERRVGKE